ncbi:MAG: UbiA family prenyltransferase [Candidatus Bathyarchaeia archaeon]
MRNSGERWVFVKICSAFKMLRPVNCLMIGFAVIVGEVIALRGLPAPVEAILGASTAAFLMAGTMAINDYYDLEVDRVNRPDKPLPSGIINPLHAIILGVTACGLGLVAAALLNISSLLIALFALVLMLYYNAKGKRGGLPGNIIVSTCIGLPFIYGGAAVGKITPILLLFSSISFMANLGREITKGIVDVEGDRAGGVRTVAVRYGPKVASRVASIFYLSAVGLSLTPLVFGLVGKGYIPLVLVSDVGFITSAFSLLRKHSRVDSEKVKNRVLIWMFLGLLAFVAGSI